MSDVKRPLGAQISHALKDRDVEVIFGIPGVHNVELYRGIEEAGITHVLARHEQGAGFMADGYARATGKPGVAYVITGPGLCNIMTPMGQAYSDSVPMLVVSSCLDETASRKGQLHQMKDQEGAAACVCDWSHEARDADSAYQLIDRAFSEFRSTRPRPKHVQVPIDVLGAQADPARDFFAGGKAAPTGEQVAAVAAELARAKKPMFIFGGGARAGYRAARQILERTGAASFTSYAGRGIVAADDPFHFGAHLAHPESERVIAEADLVVVVGSELAEVDLWRKALGSTKAMIRIDIDPSVLAERYENLTLTVNADAALFLEALLTALPEGGETGWKAGDVSDARARWSADTDVARPGIVPICNALAEIVPQNALIYSDMTQIAYVAKEVMTVANPGQWHHPFGFGTLGYALPAAIGGKIGAGQRPTICIAGDYGFHYTMQELGVAVELGLSLPIILWDNGKLKEIEDSMTRAQIAPNSVIARNPDFVKLAEAFGAAAKRPSTLADLQADLVAALETAGPTLIHVTPGIV